MPVPLELVETPNQLHESILTFNEAARHNDDRALRLLRETTYWIFDKQTDSFGPSKFVAFRAMDFNTYDAATKDVDAHPMFDGHAARTAIERLLNDSFAERPDLAGALQEWGQSLLGSNAFGNADRAKWRFIELSTPRRNPAWQRDELILALDLYERLGRRVPDDSAPEVIALSELLNSLPIHVHRPDQQRFRNPNGVALKLANFRSLEQPGHGMERGGRLDRVIWQEFQHDAKRLRELADAIRAGASTEEADPNAAAAVEEDEEEFPEGRVIYRLHRARERNRAVVERKKARVRKQHGKLACEVCTFDFSATYGALGDGYIECHHASPLAEVTQPRATRLEDLILVCANCHRMIHRKRPWLSAEQVRHLLR